MQLVVPQRALKKTIMKFKLLRKKTPKDQGIREEATKFLGTLIIILSGIILFLDKIFFLLDITLENNHGWNNTEAYIWNLSQTISPLLIMLGMYLRAYFISLIVPIFCYVLQFYFVMNSSLALDNPLTFSYVAGTALLVLVIMHTIKRISIMVIERKIKEARAEIEKRIEELKSEQ